MKQRKVYVPVLCTLWTVIPAYVTMLACFTTDIVDEVCMPWGFYNSVAAEKLGASVVFLVEYFLPLSLMTFWYSRIAYALRTKVTAHSYRRHAFYSASALLAMQTAVLARGILSVCLSVRHIPVFCPDE